MQCSLEQLFTVGDALGFTGLVKLSVAPALLVALNDKCARFTVERIRVRLEQAMFIFTDDERERVEDLMRSIPDIARFARSQARLEYIRVGFTNQAVDSIGADHEVKVLKRRKVRQFPFRLDLNAQFNAACRQ